ncbi:MAG: hypothetical protein KDA53_09970 [Hyphomonas sp.]|nr:hypothetical protein [Hyphomonas sp.]
MLALSGCASAPAEKVAAFQDGPVCHYEAVEFSGDFEGGRLSACRQEGDRRFALYFRPEDTPINPSSWYAFAIEQASPRELELSLNYVHGWHRYVPKVSLDDGETWAELEATPSREGKRATIRPPAAAGRVLIAGQPLFNLDRYRSWMDELESHPGVERQTIGASEAGREIEAISFGADGAPVLVLIGRQHPPEIPGAIAMQAFVNRLLEDDPLAVRFRQAFRVELIPVLNPDGVALGHWRHNTRGVDVNRDWGPFTQAESRAARDWMAQLGDLAVAIDFHGTRIDTLYTQPDDVPGERAGFPRDLSEALIRHLGARAPKRDAAHNPDLPTSKTWIHTTYSIPALTYEVGDATPLPEIDETARVAAEVTMHLLLEEPA